MARSCAVYFLLGLLGPAGGCQLISRENLASTTAESGPRPPKSPELPPKETAEVCRHTAEVLEQVPDLEKGGEQAELLLKLDPGNMDYLSLAATAAVGLGEHERSIVLYQAMLAAAPNNPDVHLWLGHALKTIDQVPDAIESYRAAASARPDFGDAYWSLANLKTYRFDDAEIARMQGAEQALTDARGLPGRPWYKHLIYAPGLLTGYGAKTLPGVREAIEGRRWAEAGDYVGRTAAVLGAISERLDKATALLAAPKS